MEVLTELILHTDDVLMAIVSDNIARAYLILFLIIFCETGLILFPFLPGDGLLFSAGVVAASSELHIFWLIALLILAATTGNICNYFIGKVLGKRVARPSNRFLKRQWVKHIGQTKRFYQKYGAKSIIISRFFPIVRTYIPFFAGIVAFPFRPFFIYTLAGAALWVSCFTLTGFFLGEIPWVQNNYGLIFLGLIVLTIVPFVIQFFQRRLRKLSQS